MRIKYEKKSKEDEFLKKINFKNYFNKTNSNQKNKN
jgi:hypothetical protein